RPPPRDPFLPRSAPMLDRMPLLIAAAAAAAALALPAAPAADPAKPAGKRPYGTTADGKAVDEYTLTAGPYTAKLITYGAALSELHVPDKLGRPTDVVLGFDDLAGWQQKGNPFFGCTVGRVANRVAKGRFTLDGQEY